MVCTDGASCELTQCGSGCSMECDGPTCSIGECGLGCVIGCDAGRTCEIGSCYDGGCHLSRLASPSRSGGSELIIAECAGGRCNIECGPLDTCSIGPCAAGDCTILCHPGATCTCGDAGCTIVVP
jgi:hypothetical protein